MKGDNVVETYVILLRQSNSKNVIYLCLTEVVNIRIFLDHKTMKLKTQSRKIPDIFDFRFL